jgi:hypothetical protein
MPLLLRGMTIEVIIAGSRPIDNHINYSTMKKIAIMVGSVLVLALASCSSTKVTNSWKANDAGNLNSKKVLVLAISNNTNDMAARINMEQELANNLRESNINAVSASTEFNPQTFRNMNEQRALRMLRNRGYDDVLSIVMLDKSKEQHYTPGTVMYEPYGAYYSRFWGYYRTIYGRVYTPGYYTTETNYFWESNLYDLRNNKLLYSVQSKSFDPSSEESLSKEYSRQIVKDMVKQGLLAKK